MNRVTRDLAARVLRELNLRDAALAILQRSGVNGIARDIVVALQRTNFTGDKKGVLLKCGYTASDSILTTLENEGLLK